LKHERQEKEGGGRRRGKDRVYKKLQDGVEYRKLKTSYDLREKELQKVKEFHIMEKSRSYRCGQEKERIIL